MFRKELADVLRQTAWFLAAMLAIPAALLALEAAPRRPFLSLFLLVLQPGLFFWALFLGATIFSRERGQKALEYALSLPYKRRGLLIRLAGARLLVWIALWLGSVAAALLWTERSSLGDVLGADQLVALWGLTVFFVALSLAPLIENFIVLNVTAIFVWLLSFPLDLVLLATMGQIKGLSLGLPFGIRAAYSIASFGRGPILGGFLVLFVPLFVLIVPFAFALYAAFPRFDIRPPRAYRKKYLIALFLSMCIFRPNPAGDSGPKWPLIPAESGHRFRSNPATFRAGPESLKNEAALDNLTVFGHHGSSIQERSPRCREKGYPCARSRMC